MKSILIGLLCVLVPASPALAQCGTVYRSRVSYAPTYHAPVYHEPVVKVVKEIAYQAVIPVFQLEIRKFNTYGAVYLPPVPVPDPAAPPAPAATATGVPSSEMRQVLDIIKGFDARLRALEERAGPATKAIPKEVPKSEKKEAAPDEKGAKLDIPDVHLVAQKNCAACHDAKQGEEAAGSAVSGPVIVTKGGKLAKMPDRHKTLTLVKLAQNKMCPGASKLGLKPLTQEEYASFVVALGKEDS